jgi:hypothetical protein
VACHELAVDRGQPATAVRAVHHVVVHEREGVQQLERRTCISDQRMVRRAAGADERPVTERGTQALPPGEHQCP